MDKEIEFKVKMLVVMVLVEKEDEGMKKRGWTKLMRESKVE